MYTAWKTATIPDGAKLSAEVDLGGLFSYAIISVPNLTTSSVVNVLVSDKSGGTFEELYGLYLATPGDLGLPKQKVSVVQLCGAQFIKIGCADNQTGDKEIFIRGGD